MKPDPETTKELIRLALKIDEITEQSVFEKCNIETLLKELKEASTDIDKIIVNVCRKKKEN